MGQAGSRFATTRFHQHYNSTKSQRSSKERNYCKMSTPAPKLQVVVNKPTPYTFDLGLLLASDPNPLLLTTTENLEDDLAATARDGAQALLNQLLSTCPIASTPNGVLLSLPEIETRLPREKPLPPPKAQTTWEKFAAKKGIKSKTAEQRKKMVYDEATGEWVPKWGYKGANKGMEGGREWRGLSVGRDCRGRMRGRRGLRVRSRRAGWRRESERERFVTVAFLRRWRLALGSWLVRAFIWTARTRFKPSEKVLQFGMTEMALIESQCIKLGCSSFSSHVSCTPQ